MYIIATTIITVNLDQMIDKLSISLKYIYNSVEHKYVKHAGFMGTDFNFEKPINKNAKVW